MKVIAKQNRELLLINAQNTQNENKAEILEIEVPEKFEDYNKKIVFDTDDGVVWDVITDNQYKITNAITKYDAVDFYIWLTKDDEDWRSKTKVLNFYKNKDASGEITPEEISGVNTVINLLEDEIDKVERLNISVEKVGKVTTLTITYKDGTQGTFEILDGNDGQDGQDGEDYVITPEDYQAIANIVLQTISIPTKTSDLTNDSGFIDNTVSNLTNYYNKNESYNKDEIDGKLSSIYKYKGTVATYSDLPSADLRIGDTYNVEEDGSNYAWNGTEWDKLGGDVDLSNYYNKTQTDTLLNGKVDNSTLNDYYTKTRADELLNTKVDKTTYNSKVEELETELGEKIEESDLADYVKNTDYATDSKGGVIKTYSSANFMINANGNVYTPARTYAQYQNDGQSSFIGKGTLENVITGKQLINQTQLEESQTAQDELISELQEENKELYDAMAKVTGSGTDVTLNNTAKGKMPIEVSGNTEQDGEPTPEEESPVKVVTGENTVVVGNKNLFDGEVETGGIDYNTGINNNDTDRIRSKNYIPVKPNTDYILKRYTTSNKQWAVRFYGKDKEYLGYITATTDATISFNNTFKNPSGTEIIGNIYYVRFIDLTNDLNVKHQLEESTTSTPYEEHKETRLPLNLGSIELCKIGEYKDYPWKDESTGKWYVKKLIDKVVLNGSEEWSLQEIYQGITQFQYINNNALYVNDTVSRILSNYFKGVRWQNSWTVDNSITIGGNFIRIMISSITILADFKIWLSTHNTPIYYVLKTPTDIEITNTTLINQLEAIYNTAKSYKGTTHIYTEVEEGNVAPILDATAIMDLNSLVQN